jgi:predicted Zn finger-like uncharacterized protein
MPFPLACPNCDARLTIPDEVAGKRIKCKNCGEAFVARRPRPADEEPDPPRSKASPPPAPKRRSEPAADEHEDGDDAPRTRSARSTRRPDEDDADRPRGRRRDEDEDDAGRPATRGRQGKAKGKKGGRGLLIVLFGLGALVLFGGGVGAYLLFGPKKLPGDGLEVVTLDAVRHELLAGKPGVQEQLQGKVLEIDGGVLSYGGHTTENGETSVTGLFYKPDTRNPDGTPIRGIKITEMIRFDVQFPLSDPRNASLKDVGTQTGRFVPIGKVRGIVEAVMIPPGQPRSKEVVVSLKPAWLVGDENVRPGGSTQPSTEESPYTGAGFELLPAEEIDAEIYEPYQMNIYGQWYILLDLVPNGELDTKAAQVFLRPDQQSKISDLWPFQRVRIRGQRQKKPLVEGFPPAYFAGEVLSVGPAPPHVTVSAADLLNEFRADHAAAEKKYSTDWAKITGVVDQVHGETLVLKADGPDGVVPNRIEFRANELT